MPSCWGGVGELSGDGGGGFLHSLSRASYPDFVDVCSEGSFDVLDLLGG